MSEKVLRPEDLGLTAVTTEHRRTALVQHVNRELKRWFLKRDEDGKVILPRPDGPVTIRIPPRLEGVPIPLEEAISVLALYQEAGWDVRTDALSYRAYTFEPKVSS